MSVADNDAGRRLGPNSERKVAQILAAARDRFTECGFGGASMDDVAQLAGVSKATVYAHFKSKSDLFAAVIANEGRGFVLALEQRPGEAIDATLTRFGRAAFALFLAPHTIAVYRSIAAETSRFPDLGRIFFESGPAFVLSRLAEFLGHAMADGLLRRDNPDIAAAQFFSLILGDLQLRALVGLTDTISSRERSAVLVSGVATFLRAYERPLKIADRRRR